MAEITQKYNSKRPKLHNNVQIHKNLKYFNFSSNEAENQMAEFKTGVKIKLLLTGNRLWPVVTETKLQNHWKEMSKLKTSNSFFNNNCFQKS